jgi:hypothetical protein
MTKKPSTTPSLRQFALDHIQHLTEELKKSGKLTHEQALLEAVQTPEGYEARRIYNLKGSELPFAQAINQIVKRELEKKSSLPTSMRDQILAKRQLDKEGGSGGSGLRGGTVESPVTAGRKTPADSLTPPATGNNNPRITPSVSPSDAIYAGIRAAALRAAPAGTTEAQAIAAYLATSQGQAEHARWNAARLQEATG